MSLGHEASPAGLVARAQSRPVVAVKVFIEEEMVAPMRIGLELLRATIDRTLPLFIPQEDPAQPIRDLLGDLEEVHHLAGPGGAFNFEIVAVIEIEIQERPDNHDVHRHPDRPSPVGVAAEHAGVGFPRQVVHPVLLAAHVENIGVPLVKFGERADAVGAQELVLIEHRREDPPEPLRIEEGHDPPLAHAIMPWARGVNGFEQLGHLA